MAHLFSTIRSFLSSRRFAWAVALLWAVLMAIGLWIEAGRADAPAAPRGLCGPKQPGPVAPVGLRDPR